MERYHVAAYYFPNYHEDIRNQIWHGENWNEWALLKAATPRFAGHKQPKVPLWGYEDESDPKVMSKKIDAAANHGIEAFIFDWYWYDDGPFLQRALEEGFLRAENNSQLQFSLMWANHDWFEIQPAIRGDRPVRKYGMVDEATFVRATDHMIENYFSRPNYWKVDGKLYFSIYELYKLVVGLGGVENTARVLNDFRQRIRDKGLGELHLNAVVWGIQNLPGEQAVENPDELIPLLGFDSVTSYVWIHYLEMEGFPVTDYGKIIAKAKAANEAFALKYPIQYIPNVTVGWDASPRTIQTDSFDNLGYPYVSVYENNTPENFESALQDAKEHLDNTPLAGNVVTINAWNEWTEGSYLEPDSENGYGYLEAIRKVFG